MFVVVAGSLRVLLPCVRVGAFVCAYLMLTLIWTVLGRTSSLLLLFFFLLSLSFDFFLFVSAVRVPRVCVCQKFDLT